MDSRASFILEIRNKNVGLISVVISYSSSEKIHPGLTAGMELGLRPLRALLWPPPCTPHVPGHRSGDRSGTLTLTPHCGRSPALELGGGSSEFWIWSYELSQHRSVC